MNDRKGNQTFNSLLSNWINSAADFWGSMLQNWPNTGTADDGSTSEEKSRAQESFEAVFKSWQTLSSVAGDPGALQRGLGGHGPQIDRRDGLQPTGKTVGSCIPGEGGTRPAYDHDFLWHIIPIPGRSRPRILSSPTLCSGALALKGPGAHRARASRPTRPP